MTAFGAQGDGVTDDTAAIQSAIDAGTGVVYFPPGDYLVGQLTVKSDRSFKGATSATSRLVRKSGLTAPMMYCDSGSSSVASNIARMFFRDLGFVGRSVEDGFSEQRHTMSLNGVSDVVIERCEFSAFQGDGIYLGSGVAVERHNERVTISDCTFDGVNNANRNGISVIDGTDVTIDGCEFTNCSTSTMPGAVCIEPNANTYHRIRRIAVTDCTIDACEGFADIVIATTLPLGDFTTALNDVTIDGCTFTNTDTLRGHLLYVTPEDATGSTPSFDLTFTNNTGTSAGVRIDGLAGGTFSGNTALGTATLATDYDNFDVTGI